jgi:hypothetical protein
MGSLAVALVLAWAAFMLAFVLLQFIWNLIKIMFGIDTDDTVPTESAVTKTAKIGGGIAASMAAGYALGKKTKL